MELFTKTLDGLFAVTSFTTIVVCGEPNIFPMSICFTQKLDTFYLEGLQV